MNSAEQEEWIAAAHDELQSLRAMEVYELVPRTEIPDSYTIKKVKI